MAWLTAPEELQQEDVSVDDVRVETEDTKTVFLRAQWKVSITHQQLHVKRQELEDKNHTLRSNLEACKHLDLLQDVQVEQAY